MCAKGSEPIGIEPHMSIRGISYRDVMLLVSRLSNMRFLLCDPGTIDTVDYSPELSNWTLLAKGVP